MLTLGSIVLSQTNDPSGDVIGIGNILYGIGTGNSVPEPDSLILMLTGTVLLAFRVYRKKRVE